MTSFWVFSYEVFVWNCRVPIFVQSLRDKITIWNCQVFMSVTWKVFTFQRWPHNFIGAMKHIQNALQNSHVSTLDFSLWDCQVIGGVGGGGVGWPTCTANLLLVSEIMRFWVKIGSVSWRLYARGAIAMSSLWVYYYEAFVCNREVPIFGQSLRDKRTIWNCQVFMSVTWKVLTFKRWPHNFIASLSHNPKISSRN